VSKVPTKTMEALFEKIRQSDCHYVELYQNSSYYGSRCLVWQIVEESFDYYVLYHYGTKIMKFRIIRGEFEILPGAYSATDQTAIQSIAYLLGFHQECRKIKRHDEHIYLYDVTKSKKENEQNINYDMHI